MRLWLAGAAGVSIFFLGVCAGGNYFFVNAIWLIYSLTITVLIIWWTGRVNKKLANILQETPDRKIMDDILPINMGEFARIEINLKKVYDRLAAAEFDLLDQKARLAGENLSLILKTSIDPLTGVLNRDQLNNQLHKYAPGNNPLSVVMIDIDHFKAVNDTYGHDAGDVVLQQFAGTVKRSVRPSDLVYRYGGEEFTIICLAGIKEALEVAERVREKVAAASITINGSRSIAVTASLGAAEYHTGDTPEMLIKRADGALYRAKRGGRNRVEGEAAETAGPV